MTSIYTALHDYRHRCEVSKLARYPLIWVGHYSGSRSLGQITTPALPELSDPAARLALIMLSPFGTSAEVDTSYLVVDASRVDGKLSPSSVLYASCLQLAGEGIYMGHWTVNFDGVVAQGTYGMDRVEQAISDVANRRLEGATYSFSDALEAAVELGKELYQ